MRNLLRIPLWGLVAGGVALAADWLPDALSELQFFRAREYRVDGIRLLEEKPGPGRGRYFAVRQRLRRFDVG